MIRFDLICENEHEFESWFSDNSAYENQNRQGFVTCPFCHSVKISKQLMAPGIPTKSNAGASGHNVGKMLSNDHDPAAKKLAENIRQMRKYVTENAENVGDDFTKTAREIHYQEQPERPIYGRATPQDTKSLIKEGIGVLPLPELPEEKN